MMRLDEVNKFPGFKSRNLFSSSLLEYVNNEKKQYP
jgi:hypothetical protein